MITKQYPVIEAWSGSANTTKTWDGYMQGFYIKNDGASDLTFTVNGMTFTVKTGEIFEDVFQPFNSLTITTTVAYRAYVRG
jgi:hypothetical protein